MCRCLRGCSHAMSNNEERAWEAWEADAEERIKELDDVSIRLRKAVDARDARPITLAVAELEQIGEALFARRHGPEQPE